jgi:hypothetical protein
MNIITINDCNQWLGFSTTLKAWSIFCNAIGQHVTKCNIFVSYSKNIMFIEFIVVYFLFFMIFNKYPLYIIGNVF